MAVHEGIIDLYLQVKIRSNDEIDMFESNQLAGERERLVQLDSLTVLDYIRTSIEILMHLRNTDDDKDNQKDEGGRSYRLARDADGGAASDFTSTF